MKKIAKALLGPRLLNAWRMRGQRSDDTPEQIFTSYYQENFWGDADGVAVRARIIFQ